MTKPLSSFVGLAGLLLISVSLSAHHGQAGYNTTETVTVSGAVTGFQFVNPHSIVESRRQRRQRRNASLARRAHQSQSFDPGRLDRHYAEARGPGHDVRVSRQERRQFHVDHQDLRQRRRAQDGRGELNANLRPGIVRHAVATLASPSLTFAQAAGTRRAARRPICPAFGM